MTTEPQQLSQWLPYQILGGRTVINVQIDPQTTKIWSTDLFVPLSLSDGVTQGVNEHVCDTPVRVKLSF